MNLNEHSTPQTDTPDTGPNQSGGFPFYAESVAAGFPSPAEGDMHSCLDLNQLCITNPTATYFVRARGDSMINAGIHDGDILVVDRSAEPRNGSIIIAAIGGEFTVKILDWQGKRVRLLPANPAFHPITITPELQAEMFGVVTYVVHKLGK